MSQNSSRDGMLAHVSWKLSDRKEDIAVEALGYILQAETARDVLRKIVNGSGAGVGPLASVQTQVSGEGQGRPDLVAFDDDGRECVLIEAKFWAGLTSNQPNTYLERLGQGSVLLFVVPASRIESLWPALCHRAKVSGAKLDSGREFRSVATNGRHLALTSWARLLKRLEEEGDSESGVGVRQLRALTQRMDGRGFPPLRASEFAPEIPQRLLGLQRLVDDATQRAREAGDVSTGGLKVTPRAYGYGRYVYVACKTGAEAWFGIDAKRWARGRYPDTPLWLRFRKAQKSLDPLTRRDPPACFHEGASAVPIMLPTRAEYDEVLDAVAKQISDVAQHIRGAAPLGRTH